MQGLTLGHVAAGFAYTPIFTRVTTQCSASLFNCQNVVEQQQRDNHGNLSILGVVTHRLLINRMQCAVLGHVKSVGREWMHMCTWQKVVFFFYKGCDQCYCVCWMRVGCNLMPVSGLSLLGGLHWLSIRQSFCVSWSVPGLFVDFQMNQHWPCDLSLFPAQQKGQILEACMTDRTELAYEDG